ncbi:HNH endonuclease [Mammaliicoccus sciuri]|uniref:HNH endonuclease n=1 Tax=Mammaliicoccus sciuri TaxID=1296 RepID=UPI0034DD588B
MIKLKKSEQPKILHDNAVKWTENLQPFVDKGETIPKNLLNKYSHKKIKEQLLIETNKKCAYCESFITTIDYGDIEHIKPKKLFPYDTFKWSNLTISCQKCNKNKGSYYSESLPLINPYIDDPEAEILYSGCYGIGKTKTAMKTIDQLKLNRTELMEIRNINIKKLEPLILLYTSQKDKESKEFFYNELLNYTKDHCEYSSMVKQIIMTL